MTAPSTDELMEAAMCLWEACLDDSYKHCNDFRRKNGSAETRMRVMSFAVHCHNAWLHASTVLGFDAPFDWEWCPLWLEACVDEDFDLVAMNATTQAEMAMESING